MSQIATDRTRITIDRQDDKRMSGTSKLQRKAATISLLLSCLIFVLYQFARSEFPLGNKQMVNMAPEPVHPQTYGTLTLRTKLILQKIAENIIEKKNQFKLKIRVQRSPLLKQRKVLELTSYLSKFASLKEVKKLLKKTKKKGTH